MISLCNRGKIWMGDTFNSEWLRDMLIVGPNEWAVDSDLGPVLI